MKDTIKVCMSCQKIQVLSPDIMECSECHNSLEPFNKFVIAELEFSRTGLKFPVFVQEKHKIKFYKYLLVTEKHIKTQHELIETLRDEIKSLKETIPPKLPKLKICKRCKREFFPRNPIRSQYCSDACRAKATREREKLRNEQNNSKV